MAVNITYQSESAILVNGKLVTKEHKTWRPELFLLEYYEEHAFKQYLNGVFSGIKNKFKNSIRSEIVENDKS